MQHEAIVRVLAGDLVDDEVVIASRRGLRAELAELAVTLDAAEEGAKRFRTGNATSVSSTRSDASSSAPTRSGWTRSSERELGR